jgi:hypothetical protein
MMRSFGSKKKKNEDNEVEISLVKAQGSHVVHFVDCEAARTIRADRRQVQTKCSKCERLFEKLQHEMVQSAVEDALEESTR